MNLNKFLSISALTLGSLIFFPNIASAATEVGGILDHDETWTKDQSPYIVKHVYWYIQKGWFSWSGHGVAVGEGKSLTIEPGVIVKFENDTRVDTSFGKMVAIGTESEPIVFTSIADDSADGDTNNDGSQTVPKMYDWAGLNLDYAGSQVRHSEIRYGGQCVNYGRGPDIIANFNVISYCQVAIAGANFLSDKVIEGNTLQYNNYGFYLSSPSNLVIRNNIITDNTFDDGFAYGIFIQRSGTNIEIRNNDISRNEIGIYAYSQSGTTIHDNNIADNSYGGLIHGAPWQENIQGQNNWWGHASGPKHATLNPAGQGNEVSDGIIFEPWLGQEVVIGEPEVIDPVIIIPGILGSSKTGSGQFVIDPIFHVYDNLIETLEANGYERGTNLFTFPYNWRDSNRFNALLLRDKINSVQGICQCDKVDLVAHSMGGLIAREYIQSESYENDADQLIFLGTPHLGSPESYLSWEAGEFAPGITSGLKKFIFTREAKKAGFRSLYDYIRNRPISSVQELLPIYDYLREKSSGDLRVYSNNYPQNSFLENLDIDINQLYDSGIDILNIVGDTGEATINTIRVVESNTLPLWEHGFPDGFYEEGGDRGLEIGPGDGTVSEISSTAIISEMKKIETGHVELVTQAEGIIYKELTGLIPAVLINKPLRIPNVLLVIYMLSPADLQVIAPDGKRVGKDFDTGEEINEIDGAFYSGFLTDDEFITIPNPLDGEYQIITQGTDSGGEYTVSTGYISDEVLVESDFTAQTQPGLIAELELVVDNANPGNLVVAPEDIMPPEIEVISPESRDYLRSDMLPINVNIADAGTGVLSTELKLDGIIVNDGDVIDLFFENLSNHSFTTKAADFVGNTALSDVQFRIIATIDSTISDVQRAYSLGWITSLDVRNSLIAKLLVAKQKGKLDKTLAKSFMSLLNAQRNKSINEQAYQLLIEDVNWLLNN